MGNGAKGGAIIVGIHSFQVSGIQAGLCGTRDGGRLSGQWTRAGNTSELTLTPAP